MRQAIRATLVALVAFALASPGVAQELLIYPKKDQSQEQQSKDRFECHSWSVQQTGFDPSNPQASAPQVAAPPPPQQQAQKGGAVRGAARGAAVGAAVGAIAGDAGKGAAIGAAGGGLGGAMRRRDQKADQAQAQRNYEQQAAAAQQQAQAAVEQNRSAYNRAMKACLEARDYSVQ